MRCRAYADRIEADPARLEDIDDRLQELARLKRKYGGSLDEALADAGKSRAEIAELENVAVSKLRPSGTRPRAGRSPRRARRISARAANAARRSSSARWKRSSSRSGCARRYSSHACAARRRRSRVDCVDGVAARAERHRRGRVPSVAQSRAAADGAGEDRLGRRAFARDACAEAARGAAARRRDDDLRRGRRRASAAKSRQVVGRKLKAACEAIIRFCALRICRRLRLSRRHIFMSKRKSGAARPAAGSSYCPKPHAPTKWRGCSVARLRARSSAAPRASYSSARKAERTSPKRPVRRVAWPELSSSRNSSTRESLASSIRSARQTASAEISRRTKRRSAR